MEFRQIQDSQRADIDFVQTILRDHNSASNPEFWAKFTDPANDKLPLHIGCYDGETIVGGLIGDTQLSWLKIHILAVQTECRLQGIGRTLIERAEQIAVERGCKYAFLDTMETQSPRFYEKCGYDLVGKIEDWDSHGHAKYFYAKPNLNAG